MTAVLRLAPSHPSGTSARVAAAVAECVKLDIPILPPDVNVSGVRFTTETVSNGDTGIRFGLSTIKNVGETAVTALVEARSRLPLGQFASLEDLCESVDHGIINKRVFESLIKSGACDNLGDRAELLARLDSALSAAHARQKASQRGQMDLFGTANVDLQSSAPARSNVRQVPKKTLLGWEKELLGVYLSEHPLSDVYQELRRAGSAFTTIADVELDAAGSMVTLVGCVAGIRKMTTKANRTMAVVAFEDLGGAIDVVLFPERFDRFSACLAVDAILVIRGKVDQRNDELQLLAEDVSVYQSPAPTQREPVVQVSLRVDGNHFVG